ELYPGAGRGPGERIALVQVGKALRALDPGLRRGTRQAM
ncbi:MAG: hypothetical protein AVDCRST_MAG31-597, partial [uncultured Sphingomonas sp.]